MKVIVPLDAPSDIPIKDAIAAAVLDEEIQPNVDECPNLNTLLKTLWVEDLHNPFKEGRIKNVRELQLLFFHFLANRIRTSRFIAWSESYNQVIHSDNKSSNLITRPNPYIIITNSESIKAIVMFKFKPWENPQWKKDIQNLLEIDKLSEQDYPVLLGRRPTNPVWKEQINSNDNELKYTLNEDTLLCYAVFGKYGSEALEHLEHKHHVPKNFLHLKGFFNSISEIVLY